MKYVIPMAKQPSQNVIVDIEEASFGIQTRQLGGRQYITITKNGVKVCNNVLLSDRCFVICARYKEAGCDFMPIDTQGNDNPTYNGWGDRFLLVYDSEPTYKEDFL